MHVETPAAPAAIKAFPTERYARTIEVSKRIRWDIERDVLRGRSFDFSRTFMPDSLSRIRELAFLTPAEARFLSQVQGRTYANMFALVERSIGAKILDMSRDHWLGDQVALEAMVRLADEELKHQALFRLLEKMAASGMPDGYAFKPDPDEVATGVLAKCTWAVIALTLNIELMSQAHYRSSIEPDDDLSALWKDVFLFHWKEESQHAIVDELEWRREHARCTAAMRDQGVTDLIALVGDVDGLVQAQAAADSDYFIATAERRFTAREQAAIRDVTCKAYRWQYIVSGAQEPRFTDVLTELTTPAQMERIGAALAPIAGHVNG